MKQQVVVFNEWGREYILLAAKSEKNIREIDNTLVPYFESLYKTPLYAVPFTTTDGDKKVMYHVDNTARNRQNFIRMISTINRKK